MVLVVVVMGMLLMMFDYCCYGVHVFSLTFSVVSVVVVLFVQSN